MKRADFAKKYARILKFGGVGVLNTAGDFVIFALLANALHVHPVIASIVSTGIMMVFSYFMNRRFVFQSKRKGASSAVQFFSVTIFNMWILQSAAIAVSLHLFAGFDASTANLMAKLVATVASLTSNYVCYRYIFREKDSV